MGVNLRFDNDFKDFLQILCGLYFLIIQPGFILSVKWVTHAVTQRVMSIIPYTEPESQSMEWWPPGKKTQAVLVVFHHPRWWKCLILQKTDSVGDSAPGSWALKSECLSCPEWGSSFSDGNTKASSKAIKRFPEASVWHSLKWLRSLADPSLPLLRGKKELGFGTCALGIVFPPPQVGDKKRG